MNNEHFWGNADENGVRPCVKDGCTVRVADSFRIWQRKPRAPWRQQHRELIPDCKGVLKTTERKP